MAESKRLCPFFLTRNTAIAGYLVATNVTGTTTSKTAYKDAEGAAAHSYTTVNSQDYITLNSSGMPPGGGIWLDTDQAYRIELRDSTGATTYFSQDFVRGILNPESTSWVSENIKFADGEGIADANSNEILTVTKTTNADTHVNITNGYNSGSTATALIQAESDNTHGHIKIKAKGSSGDVYIESRGNEIRWPTAAPTLGDLLYADSTTTSAWTSGAGYFAGQKDGLIISTDTDASHDINVSVGSCRDSTDAQTIDLNTTITKQIDAGWTAGDDAGGLPSGVALTNDTWYHFFIIKKSDGTIDAGFDTSSTATNLIADSGYTWYRYLGSVLTDGSANILNFTQIGDIFMWIDPTLSINTTTLSTTSDAFALAVPPDFNHEVVLRCSMTNASATSVLFRNTGETDSSPSTTSAPLSDLYCAAGVVSVDNALVLTNTSKQIYARATNSSTTLYAAVKHYRNLGL